jgi:hypothetical protein
VPGGQSAGTVSFACSSCSCLSLFSIRFCIRFLLQPVCGRSELQYRMDQIQCGQSTRSLRIVRFSWFVSGGSDGFCGLSAAPGRTIHDTWPDCPRGQCRPSNPPGQTVRQCLAALLLGSIPLRQCFRVCFKESFLRLEVDP